MKAFFIRLWYWFFSCLPLRFRCALGHHELGDSERLSHRTEWHEHEFIAPVTGDKIRCYRREFHYRQKCFHCLKEFILTGYDQKPHETDPFLNVKKTAQNSKGLNLTSEQYEQHVRKLKKETP